jgi:hypothetical protein
MIKLLSLFGLLVVTSFSLKGQRVADFPSPRVIYEYIQMSFPTAPSARQGSQVRVITQRDPQNSSLLGYPWLKDDRGEILRFFSVAELIEYMEADQGYEVFHISNSGDTNSNFNVLFRRPTELMSTSWKREDLRN